VCPICALTPATTVDEERRPRTRERRFPWSDRVPGRTWCAVDAPDPLNRQVRGSSPWRRTHEDRSPGAGPRRFRARLLSRTPTAGMLRCLSAAYRREWLHTVGWSERLERRDSQRAGTGPTRHGQHDRARRADPGAGQPRRRCRRPAHPTQPHLRQPRAGPGMDREAARGARSAHRPGQRRAARGLPALVACRRGPQGQARPPATPPRRSTGCARPCARRCPPPSAKTG
jgi:hypothetical protein